MPDVRATLDINQTAFEISLTSAVLNVWPDTLISRWIEYRAYQELVQMIESAGELPNFRPFTPTAKSLHDWLISGKGLKKRFSEETLRLLMQLQSAGGNVFNNICRFYCKWKKGVLRAAEMTRFLLSVPPIAAAIIASGGVLIYGGSIAMLIGMLLNSGKLDKVCKCVERLDVKPGKKNRTPRTDKP
jgi:hypothetical protein